MFPQHHSYKDLTILMRQDREIEEADADYDLNSKSKITKNTKQSLEKAENKDQVQSRSLKLKTDSFEISFEANFMCQHEKSFKTELQNYIEKSTLTDQKQRRAFQNSETFHNRSPNHQNRDFSKLRIFPNQLLKSQQKIQYAKDLQTEEKLAQFLQMISNTVPFELSSQIHYLSYLVWQKYIEIRNPLLRMKDLKEAARDFTEKNLQILFRDSKIIYLTFRNAKLQAKVPELCILDAFKQFLKFITLTIFLVIEEYFQNPYYTEEGKRQREQEGQNQFIDEDYSNSIFSTQSEQSQSRQFPSKAKKLF